MGSMNAAGWVLCCSASDDVDELWDLLVEFAERTGTEGPTVHFLTAEEDPRRYCVHPESAPAIEFRDDSLHSALFAAALWKASQMDPDELWRRD